jgi:hypothetical protein
MIGSLDLQIQKGDAHLQRLAVSRDLSSQTLDLFFFSYELDCVEDLFYVDFSVHQVFAVRFQAFLTA